jgi:RNA polymerase sigma-70 factor (ECF subfamily)
VTAAAEHQADTPKPVLVMVRPAAAQPEPPRPRGPAGPPTTDSEAIGQLWRLHGSTLMRFALKLTLGDRQRAEDIVQETLVRAWRHPEVVGGGQLAIRGWLFTVTRRVAIDMWRARARSEEIIDDEQTDRPDPGELIEQAVTALDVRAALAQLTPEHRQVIVEMYFHGRTAAEISDALGIPVGTVKSRTYYGIRQLRQILSAASGEESEPTGSCVPRAASA